MTYQQVCLYRIIALSTCELMRYILRNLSIILPYPNIYRSLLTHITTLHPPPPLFVTLTDADIASAHLHS